MFTGQKEVRLVSLVSHQDDLYGLDAEGKVWRFQTTYTEAGGHSAWERIFMHTTAFVTHPDFMKLMEESAAQKRKEQEAASKNAVEVTPE